MKRELRMQATIVETIQGEYTESLGFYNDAYVKALCLCLIDEVTKDGEPKRQAKFIEHVENALNEMKYVNGEAEAIVKNFEGIKERRRLVEELKKLPPDPEEE